MLAPNARTADKCMIALACYFAKRAKDLNLVNGIHQNRSANEYKPYGRIRTYYVTIYLVVDGGHH